ncbi:hypothetical protein QBC35DRAFT_241109 [Podospora australis]|uniref:Uncharacterized protein n=1 Tax=Podospora australis TaxID=1536484 RepID=A0AAN6WS57_9PEZI|nr:hypothetical protein QBC35DRAFT_241109 [Podospora australis]
MPTYYTPPPTPLPALPSPAPLPPSREDSWSRSDDNYSQSQTTRTSKSSSSSSSKSRRHSSRSDPHGGGGGGGGKHDDEESHSHKIPLAFLGSIAAASYLAHKYWPKGFIYGDKEDWELSRSAREYREKIAAEKAANRREKERFNIFRNHHDRHSSSVPPPLPPLEYADREQRRAGYRSSAAVGAGAGGAATAAGYYSRKEEEIESEIYRRGRDPRERRLPPPARVLSRDRDGGYDGYSETDYGLEGGPGRYHHRRTPSRERGTIGGFNSEFVSSSMERPSRRDSYYPPPPQRHILEKSNSHAGSAIGSRYSDPEPRYLPENSKGSAASDPIFKRAKPIRQQRPRYYEDDPHPPRASEVVYVCRDAALPPSRARRASVDATLGRRYDDRDYDWQYR